MRPLDRAGTVLETTVRTILAMHVTPSLTRDSTRIAPVAQGIEIGFLNRVS